MRTRFISPRFLLKVLLLLSLPMLFFCPTALAVDEPETEIKREVTSGVYYGYVVSYDRSSLEVFVKPARYQQPRKLFFMDVRTAVIEGTTIVPKERLEEGLKVAIKYFAEGGVAIADGIFIVEGEFKPRNYRRVIRAK